MQYTCSPDSYPISSESTTPLVIEEHIMSKEVVNSEPGMSHIPDLFNLLCYMPLNIFYQNTHLMTQILPRSPSCLMILICPSLFEKVNVNLVLILAIPYLNMLLMSLYHQNFELLQQPHHLIIFLINFLMLCLSRNGKLPCVMKWMR